MKRPRGFTLIELLVVIAIIALLIAILIPALGMAKQAAWQVQCQTREKQVGVAYRTYASDNNDAIVPIIRMKTTDAGSAGWTPQIKSMLTNTGGGNNDFNWSNALRPYGKAQLEDSSGFIRCPVMNTSYDSYGQNTYMGLLMWSTLPAVPSTYNLRWNVWPARFDQVPDQVQALLMIESPYLNTEISEVQNLGYPDMSSDPAPHYGRPYY